MTPMERVKAEFDRLVSVNDELQKQMAYGGNDPASVALQIRENAKLIIELAPLVGE